MGKLNIPKAAQIKGIRKALANKKTPKGFIPGLRKRLAKLTAAVAILFVLTGCSALRVSAQNNSTFAQTLATNVACTGAPQIFPVRNQNQTQHYVSVTSNAVTSMSLEIDGLDLSLNVYRISDQLMNPQAANGTNPVLTATGYFPYVQIQVLCTPASAATFTLSYTGTTATSNFNAGGYQIAQIDKVVSGVGGQASSANYSPPTFQPPFSSSLGTIYFDYQGSNGPAGSSIVLTCNGGGVSAPLKTFTYPVVITTGIVQSFIVPDTPCPYVGIQYLTGGASAGTFLMEYVFPQPSFKPSNLDSHVTGTTAVVVKPGPGTVQNVVVGTPVTGTFTLFDLAPAACVATPATNLISVINETAANPPASLPFSGALFVNGICAKASVAGDYTVVYQ